MNYQIIHRAFVYLTFGAVMMGGTSVPLAMANTPASLLDGLNANLVATPTARVVAAGRLQFRSAWARDFAFATPGLIKAGLTREVRETLELFFTHARASDGLLPRLLDSIPFQQRVTLGILGIQLPLGPELLPSFETENGVIAIDSNLLLISAAWNYIEATGDLRFASNHREHAQKALNWILQHHASSEGLLINQPPYSDWADSVSRQGSIGFSQLLFIRALNDLEKWDRLLGRRLRNNVALAAQAKASFLGRFWNSKGYFNNTLTDSRLSADVNWAAVAWGIADLEKSARILATLKESRTLVFPIPGRVLAGEYTKSEKSFFVKAIGLDGYHDRYYWLWITALAIKAYDAVDEPLSANSVRESVRSLIRTHRGVHEIYDESKGILTPVRSWGYSAEFPFTWSSGMLYEVL